MSSDQPTSRFAPQNKTTNERLSTTTVGLVALSDFRKRRAEVLEAQVREAREAVLAAPTPPVETTPNNDNSNNATSDDSGEVEKHRKKKAKKTKTAARARALVSFDDGDGEEDEEATPVVVKKGKSKAGGDKSAEGKDEEDTTNPAKTGSKVGANASVAVVPRVLTKAALRREAAERDALRKQFLLLQAAVKATEVAIPFVFYDGTNTPGGIVRVKKGDHAWLFLDKSRKVGAELGVGGEKSANARRDWARVGVDDLMLVRGSIIIPHHYEFYFFIMNKTMGPEGRLLFGYSAEAPLLKGGADPESASSDVLSRPADIHTLEGASDDPTFTKVVDRRWYQRNKHIYPASVWQDFDPEKDYQSEIRRDLGGNTFFFSQ